MLRKAKPILRNCYRFFQKTFVKNAILPNVFSKQRVSESYSSNRVYSAPALSSNKQCYWFHAASVGELESLWPLIFLTAASGKALVLTILSESANGTLRSLKTKLSEQSAEILYWGYSPWEGQWKEALAHWKPAFFITAKYEAWPDLWISLQELRIPLAMVSVHARKSLKIAHKACQWMGDGVPEMLLFPCTYDELPELEKEFPDAIVEVAGEPRWDRVMERVRQGNPRAKDLIQRFSSFKRPWGMIGSAWLEDLEFLESVLKQETGTLWIIPHQIRGEEFEKINAKLMRLGFSPIRTSLNQTQLAKEPACLLVDEMGLLTELYSVADWAFVGGGFGAGIHSTIEPALHGIPIGVGPAGIEKFYEVNELKKTGQLTVLKARLELQSWFESRLKISHETKKQWIQDAQARLGASEKIHARLEKFFNEHVNVAK